MIVILMMVSILVLLSQPSATTWHVEPDSTGQVINIQAGIDSSSPTILYNEIINNDEEF